MSSKHLDTTDTAGPLGQDNNEALVSRSSQKSNKLAIIVALISLYILWGSTYLGMYFALQSFPPFLMAGIRFSIAGGIMFVFLRLRRTRAALPTRKEWMGAALAGIFLLIGGNGGVAIAEQWVATGVTAVAIGAVPLWVALLSGLSGRWPQRVEWFGLCLGFIGLAFLNLGGGLHSSNPWGVVLLIVAPFCWALGSIFSQHLSMPKGAMSSAAQMLCAGVILLLLGMGTGERIVAWPTSAALWGMLFLILGGSLVAFTAYIYLLNHVRPALATSYAYVSPIVAVGLGAWQAGEQVTFQGVIAMLVILAGVVLVTMGREQKR